MRSHWWFPDSRIIYTLPEPEPNQNDSNLWEIRVDNTTGTRASKPRRITNWAGVQPEVVGATADGKMLSLLKWSQQTDVYIAELEANGRRLNNVRRFTLDERNDNLHTWTPDSKAILFDSDRNGKRDLFKQALDRDFAEQVVTNPGNKRNPVLSPDGSWILYLQDTAGGITRIMRAPLSGGPSQLVVEGQNIEDYQCARSPATLCVLCERTAQQKQILFSVLEPMQGRGRDLTRISLQKPDAEYTWNLSPDGSRLAFVQLAERDERIRIIPVTGGGRPVRSSLKVGIVGL
jgi:Tol biopolymer transport system component